MSPSWDFLRLTAVESMLSAPLGADVTPPLPRSGADPRSALEHALMPAILTEPCFVLFSGGRDSSAVLAVATHLARRIGVADPIPVTANYPDDPESDETSWQRIVLDHLAIKERIVIPVRRERTLLGETSRRNLARRGLVWPAAVQSQPVLFARLSRGAVLTGEAGDGVLATRRVTPLTLLLGSRSRPSRALLAAAWQTVEPDTLLRARLRVQWRREGSPSWLRPEAHCRLLDDEVDGRPPLRWDADLWSLMHRRSSLLALHNTAAGAAEHGLAMSHPLGHPEFVAALAAAGGRWGFRGRTHLFRLLVADLLPDAVLSRTTKARFNSSRWGEEERAFAREWTGGGMRPDLVDADALRAEWLSNRPQPAATFLAHVAWLHDQEIPWSGAPVPAPPPVTAR